MGILFSPVIMAINEKSSGFVFVPMYGDSFFTIIQANIQIAVIKSFRPHVWGFFFHNRKSAANEVAELKRFSSPCMGILFSPVIMAINEKSSGFVFVPMYGDSFFTHDNRPHYGPPCRGEVFVPMYGDSFFTLPCGQYNCWVNMHNVFVPMYGDSFFT